MFLVTVTNSFSKEKPFCSCGTAEPEDVTSDSADTQEIPKLRKRPAKAVTAQESGLSFVRRRWKISCQSQTISYLEIGFGELTTTTSVLAESARICRERTVSNEAFLPSKSAFSSLLCSGDVRILFDWYINGRLTELRWADCLHSTSNRFPCGRHPSVNVL